jgi:Abnormal spindle-like microcephaly-assoc'd, ASPM-SPD-2-Hydin/Repeat of unknown function (DUF5648)
MLRMLRNGLRIAILVVIAFAGVVAEDSRASNVQFVGSVSYTVSGSTAVLTAARVENFSIFSNSGTLRMELWAFATPYNGSAQTGFRLATHSLGQLAGGFFFSNISSGTITFTPPPNGTWAVAMILTEFDGGSTNGGYSARDFVNFSQPLVIGPVVTPGQLSMASSLNFANQLVGTTSAAQSFSITNIGGTTVTISSVQLSNATDYAGITVGCTALAPGASCTGTVTFSPHAAGSWPGLVVVTSNGVGSPQQIQLSGVGVTVGPVLATAFEFYHAAFNHYFVTAIADEITKLNNGTFVGWSPTGRSFKVYASPTTASTSVCRFFSTSFAPKSSHFYTPDVAECAVVKTNPNWLFEAVVFFMARADLNGNCPGGTQPVYRLYNNGQGGAPNHRYVTSLGDRTQMQLQGWIPEGSGALGVIMCAPL